MSADSVDWPDLIAECRRTVAPVVHRLMPELMRRRFDGDDFVQDALLVVATSPTIDREKPLARLVMTIALRAMRQELRHSWRERRAATHTTAEGEDQAADHEPTAEEVAIGHELHECLVYLGTKPNVRKAIEMLLDGRDVKEIERAVGWRPGVGPQRFLQLRMRFRRHLGLC